MKADNLKAYSYLKKTADFTNIDTTAGAREPEEGIDYGVVILPPIMGTENEVIDNYPAEYIERSQEKLRAYKKENGSLPHYTEAETLRPEGEE